MLGGQGYVQVVWYIFLSAIYPVTYFSVTLNFSMFKLHVLFDQTGKGKYAECSIHIGMYTSVKNLTHLYQHRMKIVLSGYITNDFFSLKVFNWTSTLHSNFTEYFQLSSSMK